MRLCIFIITLVFSLQCFAKSTPEERKALFQNATQKLKSTNIEDKVPKTGEQFPDLVINGEKISKLLNKGPVIITFYRGGWCPYCVKQLKDIQENLLKIKNNGALLIAISPEKKSEVEKTKRKNNLDFTLISDSHNTLAKKLNLTFKVEPAVVDEYKSLGIDLVASQDNEDYELPMPATFVVDRNQKIIFSFADADYTKRASTEDIIMAVKQADHK
jgi:peroxiredoxin